MKEIINKNLIKLDLKGNNKEEIIKELSELIKNDGRLNDYDAYIEEVFSREKLTTTGLGYGIAIPHGKCDAVNIPSVAFGKVKKGVDWASLDEKPVYLVFLLAVPKEAESNQHLKILAALSRKLVDDEFRQELMDVESGDRLLEILSGIFDEALK